MNPADVLKKLNKARELLASGQFVPALTLYATLVERFPNGYGEYGSAAAKSGDFELANRLWDKLHPRIAKDPIALGWLALESGKVGLNAKSRGLWNEAADLQPRNLALQLDCASVLAKSSGVEDARRVVNRCLELDPRNERARYLTAHLDRRENKTEDAERRLRELIASAQGTPEVRYSCYAELAHILDRAERFDEALSTLEEGKGYLRQASTDEANGQRLFAEYQAEVNVVKSLPENTLLTWAKGFPSDARNRLPTVAFLSGSARSGTTLLERMLDAHPAVAACDETLAFGQLRSRIDLGTASVPAQRLNVLRELYIKNMTTILGMPLAGKTLVDKNPSRTVWLPAFLRAFPELRVLIALRDPRDVMISIYFQDLDSSNRLTLEEVAQRYCVTMDAWLAVREWEGVNWIETRYEDTVADLEKEGTRVTKFLGLAWHEKQARFFEHNREKPILSNNAPDVAKPVYKRAVGRWRAYEKHLAPVLPMLEPYCREFGYE